MKKNSLPLLLVGLLLLIAGISKGQSNNVSGFYVSDCTSFLGNTTVENQILTYAQNNGFNYITLYGLGSLSWSSTTAKNQLASFISRAHLQYGIDEVGAAGELYSFFSNYVIPYNNGRTYNSEKFDVCNFEFEFWNPSNINGMYCSKYLSPNGYNCDTAGAFKFSFREFQRIKTLAASKGMITEIYLGWPNRGQVQQIAGVADRILLHAYRQTDSDVYAYSRNRLIDIASGTRTITVIPIFSSEPSFMNSYLATHTVDKPYDAYSDDYTAETGTWKSKINLQGYQWFNYTHLPHNTSIVAVATITASGSTNLTSGQSVTLTANSGSAYRWSPNGETTRSITVSTAGSYTVRVTNSTGQNATSTPVTVSVTSSVSVPTITTSGSLSICQGNYVTLTSSQASSYLWSNGETTRSIVVRAAGTFTVRAYNSSGAYATSSAKTVTVLSAPAKPVISTSGSLTLNTSNPSVDLTSTSASGYRWSSGSGNRTITVTNGGVYKVTVTNSNGCTSVSNPVTITSSNCTPPPIPVISYSGDLTINIGQSLVLTSTSGDGYLWSTGEHTRSITVTTSGTYWVRVYNKGGCFTASVPVQVIAVAARLSSGPNAPAEENVMASEPTLTAYPNPVHDQLNLKYETTELTSLTVELVDMTGRQVYSSNTLSTSGENQFQFDVSTFPKGIYFARISSTGFEKTVKVILD